MRSIRTLMANLGSPRATRRDRDFCDQAAAREVLGPMRGLLDHCPREVLDLNSIVLHDRMVESDELAYCPAVYCYATYAEADQRRPLRFHDLPGPNGASGSTIGGTGLGVSAHTTISPKPWLMAASRWSRRHSKPFGLHHGQPARRDVWQDEAINERFGGCYRDTMATMDGCWIRPRYDGYLGFQEKGGALIESHLRGDLGQEALLTTLQRLNAS